jgi:putative Mn2+ efflux pump MntP
MTILIMAVGLAMDATAVAAARALAASRITARDVLLVGLCFGGFQALMPLLGSLIGTQLGTWVAAWDHWVVFAVLFALGSKMLWDARQKDSEREAIANPFEWRVILVLGVATSLDAFAVGITLPLSRTPIAPAVITIGIVTTLLSGLAVLLGGRLSERVSTRLDVFGGLILIGIGFEVLVEHLSI